MRYRIIETALVALAILAPSGRGSAQPDSFRSYLRAVAEKNLEYLAEKYEVDIADANVRAASVFNDPEIELGYSDNQDRKLQMGQSFEAGLSYGFSLGGVRKARIGVAEGERNLSEAVLDDFLRNLKGEASAVWAEAWKASQTERLLREESEDMKEIARADSLRLAFGEINAVDASQSDVEARGAFNRWLSCRSEKDNAAMSLSLYAGGEQFEMPERLPVLSKGSESLADLMDVALANRGDLKAAELGHTLSEKNLALVKATRAMEVNLNAGYSYNTEVRNEIAPAPRFRGVTVGGSIPLKFSSLNRGELDAAKASVLRESAAVQAAEARIRLEVAQAWNTLVSAEMVMENYSSSIVEDARRIIDSRTKGYLKGETTLMELLSARQTYRETMLEAIEAEYSYFLAQVGINLAAGVEIFR